MEYVSSQKGNNFQNGRESDPQFLEALPCRHSFGSMMEVPKLGIFFSDPDLSVAGFFSLKLSVLLSLQ